MYRAPFRGIQLDEAEQELGDGISTPGRPGSFPWTRHGRPADDISYSSKPSANVDLGHGERTQRRPDFGDDREPVALADLVLFAGGGQIHGPKTVGLWIWRWTVGLSCGALLFPFPGRTAGSRRSR